MTLHGFFIAIAVYILAAYADGRIAGWSRGRTLAFGLALIPASLPGVLLAVGLALLGAPLLFAFLAATPLVAVGTAHVQRRIVPIEAALRRHVSLPRGW